MTDFIRWQKEEHEKRAAALAAERPNRDARRRRLPPALEQRISGYEATNPDFRRDFEKYELFVCEEAAALAAAFEGDADGLRAFVGMTHAEQHDRVPALKYHEHSGNTWAAAVGLARCLVGDPARVALQHGALCPLVGCVAYGCRVFEVRHGVGE